MQSNNFARRMILVVGMAVGSMQQAVAQSPAPQQPPAPASVPNLASVPAPSQAPQIGTVLPSAGGVQIQPNASGVGLDTGPGTLRRIEQLLREQAEAEIRNKVSGAKASGGGALPGFVSGPPANSMPPMPSAILPGQANVTNNAPPPQPIRVAEPSGTSDLSAYQTMSVLIIGDQAYAEISRDGVPRKVVVGDKIESWKVASIALDGVYVEKTQTSNIKKKKVSKVLKEKLANFRDGAPTVVAPVAIIPAPAQAPVVTKRGMPDSTNVSIATP